MTHTRTEKPIKLLLVEDNQGDITLITEALKECGVQNNMHIVNDGLEAMSYLHNANTVRPDIVFLDLNLPNKDGRQVLSEIKSDPHLKHIPTLVLTTSNTRKDITTCYSLHANCFMTKPLEWNGYLDLMKLTKEFWLQAVQLPRA